MIYNLYCDESCHLPNDNSDIMVLGTIICLKIDKQQIFQDIRAIKEKHNMRDVYKRQVFMLVIERG